MQDFNERDRADQLGVAWTAVGLGVVALLLATCAALAGPVGMFVAGMLVLTGATFIGSGVHLLNNVKSKENN